jgi:putative DNA primase/helicase
MSTFIADQFAEFGIALSRDLRQFLVRFRPDGYTTYVGIVPDGSTVAATFNGTDADQAATWIEEQNRARGVYFTVNPTPPELRKKPTKADITAIAGVWADIDPRDGNRGEWLEERERLVDLADELAALSWPPSLIVDSGNGIQPIWHLAEQLEATPEYRDASEVLCRRVEAALGAQGTHNIDRLLRVPGTTNFPNAKKRRQGRGETQARLRRASWRRYTWRDVENLATFLERNPLQNVRPITRPTARSDGADQHTRALTPKALADLRNALAGGAPGGWHDAMLRIVARLVHDGASDWFIRDWALQYRWPEYSKEQTLREIDTMLTGARAKGYHQAREQGAPEIDVVGGNFAKNVHGAIVALQQSKIPIYDRGGQLVRPVEQAGVTGTSGDGVRRPLGSMIVAPVCPDWIRMQLAEVAAWRKIDGRIERWKPTDPPADIARTIVAAPDEGRWPYLRAIVRHPVLLPSGRRITAQGYDVETGLLIDAPGAWPPLPDNPTREDAQTGLEALQHLLRFFPWSSDADCAVAMSLILTGLASPILNAVPGHAVDAPAAGTGKTILVNAAAIVVTGAEAATLDYGQDPEEAAKRLDSTLLAGDAMLCLDNIEGPLEGVALCQTITQTVRRLRLLGSNAMVTVPCNTFITATGNNLCLRGDIVRRMLLCRLDAGLERPEEREIPQDLLAEVRKSRGQIVRCAQTIMLAYIRAGRPKLGLAPIGSFGEWSDLVRASCLGRCG